jgi:hypothetical protein
MMVITIPEYFAERDLRFNDRPVAIKAEKNR